MIDRRCFTAGMVSLSLVSGSRRVFAGLNKKEHHYASSGREKQTGKDFAVIFSLDKGVISRVALPGRAHEIVTHPLKAECVAVGRRPGRSSVIFGPDRKPRWFHTRKDRHFLGHGVFSPDGRLFYTTENDYDGERGIIGVRDALNGFQQIGELPSHGIGPHEMALTDGGRTLIIANGGILTHPDMGRQKLNLDIMTPSLVYMDAGTGALRERRMLPKSLHQLSIRHFAVTERGTVVFGGQQNGPKSNTPPLLGFHQPGQEIEVVQAPMPVHKAMRNYVGSVAVDRFGQTAAATCPRGNLVTFWDIKSRRYLSHIKLADGCGIAPASGKRRFVMTSGLGQIGALKGKSDQFERAGDGSLSRYQWDNHLSWLHQK